METETTTNGMHMALPTSEKKKVKLVDVQVSNQNEALQLIVTFLNLAQQRGTFTLDESAKIWECIKTFQQ
jgi:hypothetical protein